MLRIFPSKSGAPTATWNNISVHSRYDPVSEAERYVRRQALHEHSLAVILEPGIGYIPDVIARTIPSCRMIIVFYHRDFYVRNGAKVPSWCPDSIETLEEFLSKNIRDDDIGNLSVLDWEPANTAFPEIARETRGRLVQYLRERQGSVLTSGYFGRKWFRNAFRNFLSIDRYVRPMKIEGHVVIAASGSSLSKAFPLIAEYRDRIFLIALPSSLEGLASRGLYPDMAVLSDGGYYSGVHFHVTERDTGFDETIIAMPLTAAAVKRGHSAFLPLNQFSLIEERLFASAKLPFVGCPSNGTVAGTALELARRVTHGRIVYAGLDLCSDDIVSHVRPHAFESFDRDASCRTDSQYGRAYANMVLTHPYTDEQTGSRFSKALRTYAGWFSSRNSVGDDILRLNPSCVELPSMKNLGPIEFQSMFSRCPEVAKSALVPFRLPYEVRKKIAVNEVRLWKNALERLADRQDEPSPHEDSAVAHELRTMFGLRKNKTESDSSVLLDSAMTFFETLERDVDLMGCEGGYDER